MAKKPKEEVEAEEQLKDEARAAEDVVFRAVADEVRAEMQSWGNTAAEVAAHLESLDVRGHRWNDHFSLWSPVCVGVIRQLKGRWGAYSIHKPDGCHYVVLFQQIIKTGRCEAVLMPEPVLEFEDRFRRGLYPELECTMLAVCDYIRSLRAAVVMEAQ